MAVCVVQREVVKGGPSAGFSLEVGFHVCSLSA